jgi:Flp pilus assembly pilin Flp
MKTLKTVLTDFLAEERGQDVVEYSLLLTLIAVMSVSVLTMVGINVTHVFNKTLAKLQVAEAAASIHIEK